MLQNQTETHTSPQNSSLYLHRECLDTHRRVHCYKYFKNKLFWANKKEETLKKEKEQLFQVNSLTLDNSRLHCTIKLQLASLCFEQGE